MSQMQEITS